MGWTVYRSYHGNDSAKAIQHYWPHVSEEEAKEAGRDLDALKTYDEQLGYLVKRFGTKGTTY